MILYEVTISVRQLCVRILFANPPTISRICCVVGDIFADNMHVKDGIIELILSAGDQPDWQATVLNEGDTLLFSDDTGQIGQLEVQTRTLFNA